MVYLDSCTVIYLVEEHPLAEKIREALSTIGNSLVCISPLVEMKCLVGPLKQNDTQMKLRYETFFSYLATLPMTSEVYHEAARIRAAFGIKTPDALHIATAKLHRCKRIFTNDTRLATIANELSVSGELFC